MGLIFNGKEITSATFNGTSLDRIIFNGTEVWSGKKYVVKNGVVVDTSIIDGYSVSSVPDMSETHWSEMDYGTVKSNTFPVVTFESETNDEEEEIRQTVYFKHTGVTNAYINGIPKPNGVSKMYVKGYYTAVPKYSYYSQPFIPGYNAPGGRVAYGTGRYNVDGYYPIDPSSGNFEIEHDLTNYEVIWLMFPVFSDNNDGYSHTVTFKITDLYFE